MVTFACLIAATALGRQEPLVLPLWPNGAPGSESRKSEPETKPHNYSIANIYNPSITVFKPTEGAANGCAIVVAPGGGHRELVYGAEGVEPAKFFNKLGITAIVLKYRLFRETGSGLTFEKDNRADAERAMRLVRSHASEWGIDEHRVGFIGFSAGGETLSIVTFQGGLGSATAPDPIDRLDSRPDFAMWIYPGGLGIPTTPLKNPPPGFLLTANDDDSHTKAVMQIANMYRDAKASLELHVLASGGHGFNLGQRSKLASVKTWPTRLSDWLSDQGFLQKK